MPVRTVILQVLTLAGSMAAVLFFGCNAEAVQMFIVAGQSNASGRGASAGLPFELARQFDVPYWFETDRGTSRNSAGQRDFSILLPLQGQIGPEIAAGRMLADRLADEVVIVKVAQGGTSLTMTTGATDWSIDSTGELYDQLIDNVNEATAKLVADGKQVELGGVFWMQGESDAKSGGGGQSTLPQPASANAYQDNLNRLIQKTRNDLGVAQLPFFVGQIKVGNGSDFNTTIFGTYDFTPTIQAAQAAVANADPNTHLIDTSRFALKSDLIHFDQTGQLDLGRAFASSYLQTVPEPSTAMLSLILFWAMVGAGRQKARCRRSPCHRQK